MLRSSIGEQLKLFGYSHWRTAMERQIVEVPIIEISGKSHWAGGSQYEYSRPAAGFGHYSG